MLGKVSFCAFNNFGLQALFNTDQKLQISLQDPSGRFSFSKMQLHYSLLYLSSAVFTTTVTALVPFPLEERSIGQGCSTPVIHNTHLPSPATLIISILIYIHHPSLPMSAFYPSIRLTTTDSGITGWIRNLPKHSRLHNPRFQRGRLLPRPHRHTMLHQKNLQYRVQLRYMHEHIRQMWGIFRSWLLSRL